MDTDARFRTDHMSYNTLRVWSVVARRHYPCLYSLLSSQFGAHRDQVETNQCSTKQGEITQ